jgi:RimJ/RimL family protein N-acetyltransferase
MMNPIMLHDKATIETVLRRQPFLHIYGLGDLDDFFWPYTTWYGWPAGSQPTEIALLYTGAPLPVLLALSETPAELARLVQAILHLLPARLYSHLSADLATTFQGTYQVEPHGRYAKMALTDPARVRQVDTAGVVQLGPAQLAELQALYQASYPGNWFDPRMLETGCYYGWRVAGQLVAVAGIHVYSPAYRVAALGNVTTHPTWRGQGLATKVVAKLGQTLLTHIDYIGLNVNLDNVAAIRCYERLGFERIATYEECLLTLPNLR